MEQGGVAVVGGAGTVYLMVVAATVAAQQEIREKTDIQLMSHYNLNGTDNFFSDDSIEMRKTTSFLFRDSIFGWPVMVFCSGNGKKSTAG